MQCRAVAKLLGTDTKYRLIMEMEQFIYGFKQQHPNKNDDGGEVVGLRQLCLHAFETALVSGYSKKSNNAQE